MNNWSMVSGVAAITYVNGLAVLADGGVGATGALARTAEAF